MDTSDKISEKSTDDGNTIKFYLDTIKKLKVGELQPNAIDLELHKPTLELDEIMENMEQINSKICEFLKIPRISISQHLDYFLSKGKSFDDSKYERLFDISTRGAGSKDAKIGSKLLDYSIKEKLVGFISKSGNPGWSEEKISEFISSIKKSNS
jgi:hypothetical protein